MLIALMQQIPGVLSKASAIDWVVVFGIITLIAGFVIRVIIPGWLHIKSLQDNKSDVTVNAAGVNGGTTRVLEAEWRGRLGNQLDQQDKRLDALLSATAAMEKVVVEIERRQATEIVPKLDTLLVLKRTRR